MKPETIAKLKQYEALKIDAKKLDIDMEFLKEDILSDFPIGKNVETDYGVFTTSSRDKWTYSSETQALDKQLKETKKSEEQSGIATVEPGIPFLIYKSKD